jgi:hypothetical protein
MKKITTVLSLGLLLALTACGPTSNPTSTPSVDPTTEPSVSNKIDYTITVLYEDETPFAGARVQCCTLDGTTCLMPKTADDNGVAVLNMEADSYVAHVLNVPEGYHYDEEAYTVTPENPTTTIYLIAL